MFPSWPVTAAFAWLPLWFFTGLHGFTWVFLAIPMLAAILQKKDVVVFKGTAWWMFFLGAALLSAVNLDTVGRLSGWMLRFAYFVGAIIFGIYILNGGRTLSVWSVVRSMTWLWFATVIGGYLAFILGTFTYKSPMYYLMPGPLLENDLIATLVTPSFAQVQDILGDSDIARPTAPYPYTNTWGSMLALLTPFAIIAMGDKRVGFSPKLVRVFLALSVVPAVVSLNRGLWLSLGVGIAYVAIRLGLLGDMGLFAKMMVGIAALVVFLIVTPLGDLIITRIDTGHSNEGRTELVITALEGTAERPLLGWGAPRPNGLLPPKGTHGQMWYLLFSHGILGAIGYCGFFAAVGLRTWKQRSAAGLWVHSVFIIGAVQMFFYLSMPNQLFLMMAAAALATRLQNENDQLLA